MASIRTADTSVADDDVTSIQDPTVLAVAFAGIAVMIESVSDCKYDEELHKPLGIGQPPAIGLCPYAVNSE